jgi:hypothetical protein
MVLCPRSNVCRCVGMKNLERETAMRGLQNCGVVLWREWTKSTKSNPSSPGVLRPSQQQLQLVPGTRTQKRKLS